MGGRRDGFPLCPSPSLPPHCHTPTLTQTHTHSSVSCVTISLQDNNYYVLCHCAVYPQLHVLTQDSGDVFKAAQVSVGMLGVVTEVTIRVTERFNLEETTSVTTIEGFLSNLEGSVGGSDHVKVWLELYSGLCQVFEANRSMEEQPRDNPNTLIENIKVIFILKPSSQ